MKSTTKSVLKVWLGLTLLLALTTGIAFVPLGSLNYGLSLAIAAVKASLVLLFFMELARESGLVRAFAAAGFFWLMLMIVMTWTDYGYRHDVHVPVENAPPVSQG